MLHMQPAERANQAERIRQMRTAAQALAQHDLIKALANYDHIVMGQDINLRAYNELTPQERDGYGWMVATVRHIIYGE